MTDPSFSEGPFAVALSGDEALVLFELLSRWCDDRDAPAPGPELFESPAETRVLSQVQAGLEAQLAAPLRADYLDLLGAARRRLSADWDWHTLRD